MARRVTNREILERVERVESILSASSGGLKDERVGVLCAKLDSIEAKIDGLCETVTQDHERIWKLDGEIGKLKTRMNLWNSLLGALSMILSALAAWLGVRN